MKTLRINNEYIFTKEEIEIEQRGKLFEEIDSINSDFSYTVTIPRTTGNLKILGLPFADVLDKTIYSSLPADIIDSDGLVLHKGQFKVETINKTEITGTFFSGNYNWITLISGNLTDLRLSVWDTDLTIAEIEDSWLGDEAIVFPLVDSGAMISRSYPNYKIEDFVAFVYVKELFKKIFYSVGVKLKGELLNDPIYNKLIIGKSNFNKSEIDSLSCFVQKTTTTLRPGENVAALITWDNDSVLPYYNGSAGAFDIATETYTAPYKMRVRVEVELEPSALSSSHVNSLQLWINGVLTTNTEGYEAGYGGSHNAGTPGDQEVFTIDRIIDLNAGDELTIRSSWQDSSGSTQINVVAGTLKITPVFLYHVKGSSAVPNWTKKQFVSNIFKLFNVVPSFDPVTKELTLNLFKKIRQKTPIDLSPYLTITSTDYTDFVSNFGRKNYLSYNNTDTKDVSQSEDLRRYNVTQFVKYGQGIIEVNNSFVNESQELVDLDFSAPISYLHPSLDCSLERLNFVSLEEEDSIDFTGVTDSTGNALFAIPSTKIVVGDLVRVTDSTVPEYNGEWVVGTRATGTMTLIGVNYISNATGTITKLTHKYSDNDDVYLMVNIPDYAQSKFSGASEIIIDSTIISDPAYAYFSLINTGRDVNDSYKQSLSFGEISNELAYQKTILETYWSNVESILNDPVKLIAEAHLPKAVYYAISPLTPVFVKTLETSSLYYVNKISGYKNSSRSCELELIKL
jgi:hypothetical protein